MEGRRKKAAGGAYDTQVTLALRFGWDALTVDAQDADYIDELVTALDAAAAVQKRRSRKTE